MPALALDCFCPGDTNISLCELASLTWVVDLDNNTTFCRIQLLNGPTTKEVNADGHFEIDLSPVSDWVADWAGLALNFYCDRSLLLDIRETCSVQWRFEALYHCIRDSVTVAEHTEYFNNAGSDFCETIVGGITRAIEVIGAGAASGTIFHSTTLGPNGCPVEAGGFTPTPVLDTRIDTASSAGPFCLCATGGTPPYQYSLISGALPKGQTLNPSTGCIDGDEDGTFPGSDGDATFRVTDAAGDHADKTCNIRRGCPSSGDLGNDFD